MNGKLAKETIVEFGSCLPSGQLINETNRGKLAEEVFCKIMLESGIDKQSSSLSSVGVSTRKHNTAYCNSISYHLHISYVNYTPLKKLVKSGRIGVWQHLDFYGLLSDLPVNWNQQLGGWIC